MEDAAPAGAHDPTRARGRRLVVATLALCALALAGGLVVVLSHAQVHQTGTNDVPLSVQVAALQGTQRVCQDGEHTVAGSAALRLTGAGGGGGAPAPALAVEVLDAATGAPLARGVAASWQGLHATARLRPPIARERPARVCVALAAPASAGGAALYGATAPPARSASAGGRPLDGRFRVEWLGAQARSWWSFAPTVVARVGRGHAFPGAWVALAAALLTSTSIALATWLLVRSS
ncbi:MAG: hypothetical protein JSS99_05665 [Actinobacteria bacterium]|nr:hypothetical protein [Actinomycetota bacterium]